MSAQQGNAPGSLGMTASNGWWIRALGAGVTLRQTAAAVLTALWTTMAWATQVWLGPTITTMLLAATTMAVTWDSWSPPASAAIEWVRPMLVRGAAGVAGAWLVLMAARRLPTRRLTAKVARIVFPTTNGVLGRDLREHLWGALFAGRGSAEPSTKPAGQAGSVDKAPACAAGPSQTLSFPDPADPAIMQLRQQLADVLQAMVNQQEALAELTKQGAQRRQEVPATPPPPLPPLKEKEEPAPTLVASFSLPTALFSLPAESTPAPQRGVGSLSVAPTIQASAESALAAHRVGAGARSGVTLGGAPQR